MRFKKHWQRFEGGPVEYALTGTNRITYWLRLNGKEIKITPATPTAYYEMVLAHANSKRVVGYEVYAFGHEALNLAWEKQP